MFKDRNIALYTPYNSCGGGQVLPDCQVSIFTITPVSQLKEMVVTAISIVGPLFGQSIVKDCF